MPEVYSELVGLNQFAKKNTGRQATAASYELV